MMMCTVKSTIKSLPWKGQNLQGDSKFSKCVEWYKEDEIDGGLTGFTMAEATAVKNLIENKCKENFTENTICEVSEDVVPDGMFMEDTIDNFPVFYSLDNLINSDDISSLPFEMEITGYNRFMKE